MIVNQNKRYPGVSQIGGPENKKKEVDLLLLDQIRGIMLSALVEVTGHRCAQEQALLAPQGALCRLAA